MTSEMPVYFFNVCLEKIFEMFLKLKVEIILFGTMLLSYSISKNPINRVFWLVYICGTVLMKMAMMNCFYEMSDQRKALSLISSREHCQRFSPSQISDHNTTSTLSSPTPIYQKIEVNFFQLIWEVVVEIFETLQINGKSFHRGLSRPCQTSNMARFENAPS